MEAAAPGTHEAVLSQIQDWPRGRLLDAPSGDGSLARALEALGFDVASVDRLEDVRDGHRCADLNRALPFDDDCFDAAVSVEGIEHLHSPRAWIHELSRVLKPAGRLIITTPNVLSVRSRWRWLTRGFHRHFTPQADGSQSSDHIHPLPYPLLRHLLVEAGFQLTAVFTNREIHNLRDRSIAALFCGSTRKRHPLGDELMQSTLLYGQILGVQAHLAKE